jgi:hypothetical protein
MKIGDQLDQLGCLLQGWRKEKSISLDSNKINYFKKRLSFLPSSAGMSLTKLSLAGNVLGVFLIAILDHLYYRIYSP